MKEKEKYNSGFKTPDYYFDELEQNIKTQVYLEKYKSSGFKLPDNYLNNFEVSTDTIASKTKVISIFNRKNIVWATSIAAAVLLLFTISIPKNTLNINSIENQTLENYLIEEISYNELESLTSDPKLSETDFIDIKTNNLENYIDNLEVDDLINY